MKQHNSQRAKIWRRVLPVGLVLFIIGFSSLPARGSEAFLYPYYQAKLYTGLKVIVKENHSMPLATVDIWVGTGAKNETAAESGISHFVEHMLFKGTAKRQPGEMARAIESAGGYLNAATSLDTTHYYVVVPSDYLNMALELQADAIMNPAFNRAEIANERQVILEELRMKEDDPEQKLAIATYKSLFAKTSYANDILGTRDTLNKISQEKLLAYFHKYYIPNNMVVTIVGDVNTGEVIKQIDLLFRDFKSKKSITRSKPIFKKMTTIKRNTITQQVAQTYLSLAFPGPDLNALDSPALSVLSVILGGGRSSRFYQELREEKKLVNRIEVGFDTYQQVGIFAITAQTKNDRVNNIEKAIRDSIAKIMKRGVTPAELNRAKAVTRSNFIYATESNLNMANIFSEYELNGDLFDMDRFVKGIDQVNNEDIRRVAQNYLNLNGYVLTVVKPQEVK